LVRRGWKTRPDVVPLLKVVQFLYALVIEKAALILCWMDEEHAIRVTQAVIPKALAPLSWQKARNMRGIFGHLGYTREHYSRLRSEHARYQSLVCAKTARLIAISPEELPNRVVLRGEEHLRKALSERRGVLLLGSHMGNFMYVAPLLASRGYRISVVAEKIPGAAKQFMRTANRFNINLTFFGDGTIPAAHDAFHRNEVFLLLFDASLRRGHTVWLPFGHTTIPLDRGSAVLALRNRVPIIRIVCQTLDNGHECITMEPEPAPAPLVNLTLDTETLLRRWLGLLYEEVLKRPEQWWQFTFLPLGKESASRESPL